jgi:hypothetical protein
MRFVERPFFGRWRPWIAVDAVARGGLGFVEALAATKPRSAGS